MKLGIVAAAKSSEPPAYPGDLIVNGRFASDAAGWTTFGGASVSVIGGRCVVTIAGVYGILRQTIATVIGLTYRVRGNIVSVAGPPGFYGIRKSDDLPPSANVVEIRSSVGAADQTFVATATTTYISLQVNGDGTSATFDNISVVPA